MLVVPVVLVSLTSGVATLSRPSELGHLGIKCVGLFLLTTTIAIVLAILIAIALSVGQGYSAAFDLQYIAPSSPSFQEVILNIIPSNPFRAMSEGRLLQLIVFSILFGLAMSLSGDFGVRLRRFFDDLNVVVMRLVDLVMRLAPLGVFALLAELFATLDWTSFAELLVYFGTVLVVLMIQGLLVYPVFMRLFAGLDPVIFLKKMRTVMVFAFSTSSSNATLPVTLRTVKERLGVSNSVAAFAVPLGATVNMDGAAIMQGVATVFIANVYGVDLTSIQIATVVVMAVLASIGAAGIPGVALILLATVLTQVGLPVEGIAIVLGVDRLLDMARTVVNVTGDAAVTCVVACSEGQLDKATFVNPDSGAIDSQPAT